MEQTLNFEDVKTALVDRLVAELDPREHVSTKAFFEHVKPESAAKIAAYVATLHRSSLEMALALNDVRETFKDACEGEISDEFDSNLDQLLHSLPMEPVKGYGEVEGLLGALRGFEDDGLAIVMWGTGLDAARRLLGDPGYSDEITKQLALMKGGQ